MKLKTLKQAKEFKYEVKGGNIVIYTGELETKSIFPLEALLNFAKQHANRTVAINATRTISDIRPGTFGNFCYKTAGVVVASYIAAIAVDMGLASPSEDRLSLVFK